MSRSPPAFSPYVKLDEINSHPGLMKHMLIEEFETIQIELDGTPGVRTEKISEIIK